jgi:hypothetical protein
VTIIPAARPGTLTVFALLATLGVSGLGAQQSPDGRGPLATIVES